MKTASTLLALGRALKQAASDHNWSEVQRTDEKLAALLKTLKGGNIPPELNQALNEVQRLHQRVMDYCQGQSDILSEKMALSQRNREGAVAYAAFINDGDMR